MKELREYQATTVEDVTGSDKDIIICLPTGAGKTVIAAELINRLPGIKVFIVPRLELLGQALEEFGRDNADVIWADKTRLTGKSLIVSSKDSLRKRTDDIPDGDVTLIFDEAHIGIKATKALVDRIKPSRVLGLTATPERMDGFALLKGSDSIHRYGVFDEVLRAETVPSLIRKGYLSGLRYYAKPIEGITEIKPESGVGEELSGKQMLEIFNDNHIWGDIVKCYEEYGQGRPAIGFTNTISLADKVSGLFTEAGYDFRTIHGGMKVKEREELINMLKAGKIHGLVNADLLTYGFDCPEASYAFSCRHIKSRPLWFQIVGRILRISPGKTDAVFIDHGDCISEFSEPDCALPIMDELVEWRADGESKEQKKARKKRLKQVRETMGIIQELDPLPSKMVEVTMENTYDRLIRIIKRLRTENGRLADAVAQKERQSAEKDKEIVKLQEENRQAVFEKELAESGIVKSVDSEETFMFIRDNYCKRRWLFRNEKDLEEAHRLTRESLLSDESRLPFYFDKATFEKGMEYWRKNYRPR